MKPKVMILTQNPKGGAGAERVVANLTKALAHRFDFQLVYPKVDLDTNHDLNYVGEHIELDLDWKSKGKSILGKLQRYRKLMRAIKQILDREQPDLVMSNLSMDWHQLLILLKTFGGIQQKVVLRFGNPVSPALKGRSGIGKAFIRSIANRVDHVIANSDGTRGDVIEKLGIREHLITRIYNPLDLDDIRRKAKMPVETPIFQTGKPIIINVGRLDRQKNQGLLLRAFAKVYEPYDAQLALVGTGKKEQEFKALVKELELEDRVHFLGWQDNPYRFVSQSTCFALSSAWEGFGNVVVEALTCECPVITTDALGGPAEILKQGEFGLVVTTNAVDDYARQLETYLQNPALLAKMKAQSGERAKDFGLDRIGQQYGDLLARVIQSA